MSECTWYIVTKFAFEGVVPRKENSPGVAFLHFCFPNIKGVCYDVPNKTAHVPSALWQTAGIIQGFYNVLPETRSFYKKIWKADESCWDWGKKILSKEDMILGGKTRKLISSLPKKDSITEMFLEKGRIWL